MYRKTISSILILMVLLASIATAPVYAADTKVSLNGRGISVEVDNSTSITVYLIGTDGAKIPLAFPSNAGASASIKVGASVVSDFILKDSKLEDSSGILGKGKKLTVTGDSKTLPVTRTIILEVGDNHPGVVFMTTKYKAKGQDIVVDRFTENELKLQPVDPPSKGTRLWSFQGAAISWGNDYILPVNDGDFYENTFALYGGIPYIDIYSRGGGLGLGSASPVQLDGISLPVKGSDQTANISFQWPRETLKAGIDTEIGSTFIVAHRGDFYAGASAYAKAMATRGVSAPAELPETAYYQQWETYGYGLDFTVDGVISRLDDLIAMGIKSVDIDAGWYKDFKTGDYIPNPAIFPKGDADIKALTDGIHAKGLKAVLWWMPGDVSPGTTIDTNHPEWFARDINGEVQHFNGPWGEVSEDRLLCPSLKEVQDWHRDFTQKAVQVWGFDGFKLDSQYNVAGPCYAENHGHQSPDEAEADYAKLYKTIFETAKAIKPDFTVNICNCGVSQNMYLLPYQNRMVVADPTSPAQVRQRAKLQKAFFGPASAVLGDHVELYGNDFASSLATGCVLETKYTTLNSAEKVEYSKWLNLGKDLGLSSGQFMGDLYLYGFDDPEAYAVKKEDIMFYGFFADSFKGNIELRGLESGKTYKVMDYINGTDYGTVTGPTAALKVSIKSNLLLAAVPSGGKAGDNLPEAGKLRDYMLNLAREYNKVPEDPLKLSDSALIPGWARASVTGLALKGIIANNAGDAFRPQDPITKAEFIKLLMTTVGKVDEKASVSFTDVKESDWFYKYVASAVKEGIAAGKTDQLFAPYEKMTRQDMVVMLSKALTLIFKEKEASTADLEVLSGFKDRAAIPEDAQKGMALAVKYGFISGYGDGTIKPGKIASRAEAARILYKILTSYSEAVQYKQLKEWDGVENYTYYSGAYDPALTGFDVAIIRADLMTKAEISKINTSGTYTIGYLSMDDGNGKKDLQDAAWQAELIDRTAADILAKGCHGLFLDDIDTNASEDDIVDIIKRLHEKYPDAKLVVNGGVSLLGKIAPYISGEMVRAFSSDYDTEYGKYLVRDKDSLKATGRMAAYKINAARKANKFNVFSLDYAQADWADLIQKYCDRAWEYDFIPYVSAIDAGKIYRSGILPQSKRGVKAEAGERYDPNLPPQDKDIHNKALASNGAEVSCDSTYAGYDGPDAVNDGYICEQDMDWSIQAWASDESKVDHWIAFTFPQEEQINEIKIYWAEDVSFTTPSELKVQKLEDGKWMDVKSLTGLPSATAVTDITFEKPESFTQLRLLQPAGKGCSTRPDLMWIYEIGIY